MLIVVDYGCMDAEVIEEWIQKNKIYFDESIEKWCYVETGRQFRALEKLYARNVPTR